MTELRAWDKRPDERAKPYLMFTKYLGLIDHNNPAVQTRSIARLIELTGYNPKSKSALELWSRKYDWVARAGAYDAHMASQVIVYREVELGEYQAAVVGSLVKQLVSSDRIINKALEQIIEQQTLGKQVEAAEIQRILKAMREKDDLARRAGKMPTAFTREQADEDTDAVPTFIVGGDYE